MNYQHSIYTTVDITPTGVYNNDDKLDNDFWLKRNQQSNFDSLCQTISLRSNIFNIEVESFSVDKISSLFPDPNLPDVFKIWHLGFTVDRFEPFGENHSALLEDLHLVPIIPNLTETTPIFPSYFMTIGDLKNIYII